MRFFTKKISENHVRFSYYLSFLLMLGNKILDHVDSITSKAFDKKS